ncbi:MAG: pyridoxal phosphate-dependent aminotransferase, partial [Deltaproteobacteria bacterium]|nr:pyridoxal phosphate-dependent aminotransferase [Deltaproteobacteria bacterium]
AREAIAEAFAPRFSAEGLLLTASSSEAYALLFKLLCDCGDRVLLPRPSYPLLEHLARLEGLEVVFYQLRYAGGWEIDFDEVATMSSGAKALVLVNPNNPTGSVLGASELRQLGRLCGERGLALISDEVFFEYLSRPELGVSASGLESCLTFTLGGLSKACALPQFKLSWVDVSGPREEQDRALAGLELIADTYLSVSTPTLLAAPALLDIGGRRREKVWDRLTMARAAVEEVVRCHPSVTLLPAHGGWSALVRVPALEDEESLVLRILEDEHVLVHPGYFFDMDAGSHLVCSLLTEPEVLKVGLNAALGQLEVGR